MHIYFGNTVRVIVLLGPQHGDPRTMALTSRVVTRLFNKDRSHSIRPLVWDNWPVHPGSVLDFRKLVPSY